MSKGISAIIATILLVLITIALVAAAYTYFSGMIGGKTSKALSLSDAYCNGTHITLVVSNDGTSNITDAEVKVLIDNFDRSGNYDFGTIAPHNSVIVVPTGYSGESKGQHTLLLVAPSSSPRVNVNCQ